MCGCMCMIGMLVRLCGRQACLSDLNVCLCVAGGLGHAHW